MYIIHKKYIYIYIFTFICTLYALYIYKYNVCNLHIIVCIKITTFFKRRVSVIL